MCNSIVLDAFNVIEGSAFVHPEFQEVIIAMLVVRDESKEIVTIHFRNEGNVTGVFKVEYSQPLKFVGVCINPTDFEDFNYGNPDYKAREIAKNYFPVLFGNLN